MRSLRTVITLALAALLGACSSSGSTGESTCSSGDALRVCSTGATIKGVDVSTYQGTVSWSSVKASGHVFGFARISDGLTHSDATFVPNWHGMKAAGVIRGAYQFFRPSEDPIQQADLVIAALAGAGAIASGDLPAVLDLEVTDGIADALVVSRAKQWLAHIEAATGRKPIVYTAAFMSGTIGTSFSAYPLWVANYGASCPSMPSGWTDWRFWQVMIGVVGLVTTMSGLLGTQGTKMTAAIVAIVAVYVLMFSLAPLFFTMIQNLPPRYQMVFNLYVFEGLKHKEIAEKLGVTEGTSKSNLSDARAILQREINKTNTHPAQAVGGK